MVRLARLTWNYHSTEEAMAAADLLTMFGHEVPPRPPSWFKKHQRQRPARDAIAQARFDYFRRRLFRRFFYVDAIEDPRERAAEAEFLWDASELLTELVVEPTMRGAK